MVRYIQRSTAIASPSANTKRIGYMNTPPSWKKRTMAPKTFICLLLFACNAVQVAVVIDLPNEFLPIKRRQNFVQQRVDRSSHQVTGIRLLPWHDVQNLWQFLVPGHLRSIEVEPVDHAFSSGFRGSRLRLFLE